MHGHVFLDRDGVINRDTGYLGSWSKFEYVPGAVEALRALALAGWPIVVITNQSGIARGYYTLDDYLALTRRMVADLADRGVPIQGVYFCPHHPQGVVEGFVKECDCRKPMPGMILRAAAELDIDLAASVFVGDKKSDMQAAAAAGVGRRYFVQVDLKTAELEGFAVNGVFSDLSGCVAATRCFEAVDD
jgi:D-glycero-D-manno-heptose 1,7-bisphosphate phosphatase